MSDREEYREDGNDVEDEAKKISEFESGGDSDGECDSDSDEESDEAYRLRVYGRKSAAAVVSSSFSRPLRKFSKRLSTRVSKRVSDSRTLMRRSSSIVAESLPDTPSGWFYLSCATASAILAYEIRLQRSLSKPPITFCQLPLGSFVEKIYNELTEEPSQGNNKRTPIKILSRTIHPSLFVGTRGMIASTAAYLGRGPAARQNFVRFREVFTMSQDRARIAVDWEFQRDKGDNNQRMQESEIEAMKQNISNGPIRKPVVIILHGINNDSSFGYMKSLSRSFCNRGYISASMNFRGCGRIKFATPRGYNAAYTGDLRSLVNQISARLEKGVSIFLVGNSLGANIMTKYLGEEGMSDTLPSCVSGGASLGNPLLIDSNVVKFPFNILMALGVKKIFLENFRQINSMKDSHSQDIVKHGFMAPTIAKFDNAIAPGMVRNNPYFPFETRIGYENGEAYWFDSSSYRYIKHISVPFLNITAQDDFLVSHGSRNKLGFCLANPNVMVVETRCGGHLGWQEAPPKSAFGSSSWSDTAASDFFDAILKVDAESSSGMPIRPRDHPEVKTRFGHTGLSRLEMRNQLKEVKSEALAFTKGHISSRL